MPKVTLSAQCVQDHDRMMAIVDHGYVLRNKQYDPTRETYSFDIEGPDINPEWGVVDILFIHESGGVRAFESGGICHGPNLPNDQNETLEWFLRNQINEKIAAHIKKGSINE